MARSHVRPRLVRTAAAALFAALATAAAARAAGHRPLVRPERPGLPCHRAGADVAWSAFASRVYDEVEQRSRKLGLSSRTRVARTILEETARVRLDPRVVLAVIQVESGFDPHAVSGAGAAGLMQLLGPTMREEAARSRLRSADPHDPVANVRAGIRYLSRLAESFDDLPLALLAYNAGPARIRAHLRAGAIPDRLLAYPRMVQAELEALATRWGHPALRLAAARPPPAILAMHAPVSPSLPADPGAALRPGTAPAPVDGVEMFAAALPPDRLARRAAVRTPPLRARLRRRSWHEVARWSRVLGRGAPS